MANVNIKFNNKDYLLSCDDGQEENLEKNQLLREKEESDKNFRRLSKQHQELKSELEKIDKEVSYKFGNRDNFNKKIDELNQETETLIDEIEKWQT